MQSLTELIGLAIVLFISTNVDDLVVLIGFFADAGLRPRQVVAGQYLGIAVLFGLSAVGALLSLVISAAYLGLLGMVPIGIGLTRLFLLRSHQPFLEKSDAVQSRPGHYGNIVVVALVTMSNGGDNVGIYLPAFAVRSASQIVLIAVVFIVMTAVWCLLAYRMVSHPRLGAPLRRYAHIFSPIILIGLGVLILQNAGTLAWLVRLL